MLTVIRKDTNEIIWTDDACDGESCNKAYDFITYKNLFVVKKEYKNGNMTYWVKP